MKLSCRARVALPTHPFPPWQHPVLWHTVQPSRAPTTKARWHNSTLVCIYVTWRGPGLSFQIESSFQTRPKLFSFFPSFWPSQWNDWPDQQHMGMVLSTPFWGVGYLSSVLSGCSSHQTGVAMGEVGWGYNNVSCCWRHKTSRNTTMWRKHTREFFDCIDCNILFVIMTCKAWTEHDLFSIRAQISAEHNMLQASFVGPVILFKGHLLK